MRGAAPSIVCPRCGQQAPPAGEVSRFVTCAGCGMSIDSTARERLVPVRRARPESEPPVVEAPVVKKQRKPGDLSALQIFLILGALFGGAYIKTEYFPSDDDRARQAEIDEIQASHRATRAHHDREMSKIRASLHATTGDPACVRLSGLVTDPPKCSTQEAQATLRREIEDAQWRREPAQPIAEGCQAANARIDAAMTRLGCTR